MKKIIIAIAIVLIIIMLVVYKKRIDLEDHIIASTVKLIGNEIPDTEISIPLINAHIIQEEIREIASNYSQFSKIINQADIKLPIIEDMVPQGITLMNDYVLITAYDANGEKNSQVYVLNNLGELINTVDLGTKSHVGGISYDKVNDLIWLPDSNGILNAYDSKSFINKNKVKPKQQFNNVSEVLVDFEDKNKKLIAFLTVDEEYIYIGNFSKKEKSIVKKYRIISKDDYVFLEYIDSFMVPPKTQSIAFFSKGETKYIIMSNSYTRKVSSYIQVYIYDIRIDDYSESLIEIELPPMLEQIVINGNSLYIIFESSAKKYSNCLEKMKYICILDIYRIISKN